MDCPFWFWEGTGRQNVAGSLNAGNRMILQEFTAAGQHKDIADRTTNSGMGQAKRARQYRARLPFPPEAVLETKKIFDDA